MPSAIGRAEKSTKQPISTCATRSGRTLPCRNSKPIKPTAITAIEVASVPVSTLSNHSTAAKGDSSVCSGLHPWSTPRVFVSCQNLGHPDSLGCTLNDKFDGNERPIFFAVRLYPRNTPEPGRLNRTGRFPKLSCKRRPSAHANIVAFRGLGIACRKLTYVKLHWGLAIGQLASDKVRKTVLHSFSRDGL